MNDADRDDLQRWLDGSLDERERADFERRCDADPELRAELELHQEIGRSLQRSFAVPDLGLRDPPASEARPAPETPSRWLPFVLGAVSAAALLLAWLQPWTRPAEPAEKPQVTEMLRTAVGRSWLAVCDQPSEPRVPTDWVRAATQSGEPLPPTGCSVPGQLPDYVQPLAPDLPSPLVWRPQPDVEFQRGLETQPNQGLRVLELIVSQRTRTFLFVVPAATDPRPTLPTDSAWRLFRGARGPLVLYELTPLDEPHGLQCVTDPQ